jgi:hypothetical protein
MPFPSAFLLLIRPHLRSRFHFHFYPNPLDLHRLFYPFFYQSMGHEKVSILDGGLPRWIHEGFEMDSEDLSSSPASEKGEVLMNGDIQVSRTHIQGLFTVSARVEIQYNSMGRLRRFHLVTSDLRFADYRRVGKRLPSPIFPIIPDYQ